MREISRAKSEVSFPDILCELDRVAEGVPFAAFGQTPLWDEPMKAIVAAGSSRPMIAGIHDLDFFSRVRSPVPDGKWHIVTRNDGGMKDAWIAAGELSALFGAEVWPSRQALAEAGVRLDYILPARSETRQRLLEGVTAAWGWRGVVENTPIPSVVCDLKAAEVAPAFFELLQWGFRETSNLMVGSEERRAVKMAGRRMAEQIENFIARQPDASLSELYEHLLRYVYEMLLGVMPKNVTLQNMSGVLKFNRKSAGSPRFRLIEPYLDPRLRGPCRAAYDAAVANSGITQLAAYGEGSLPFDVYVPRRGRGTLFVTDEHVRVDLPKPVNIPLEKPLRHVEGLAALLEDTFGSEIALVGKAVSLIAMLAAEFVMVFNETGSAYLPRTRKMLDAMIAAGASIQVHPMLRMRLHTWDSLQVCRAEVKLPEHLAQAFGRTVISAGAFAHEWRHAVRAQRTLLGRLGRLLGSCELLDFLSQAEREIWLTRLEKCNKANEVLLEVQRRVSKMRGESAGLRTKEDEVAAEIAQIEKSRGELNRDQIRPLKRRLDSLAENTSAAERKRLQSEHARAFKAGEALLLALEAKRSERRSLREHRREVGKAIYAVERSSKAVAARRTLRVVERAVARERMRLARNAILASEGLSHANLRPAAWWMPTVDPTGRWFARIAETAVFRLEFLLGVEE